MRSRSSRGFNTDQALRFRLDKEAELGVDLCKLDVSGLVAHHDWRDQNWLIFDCF